MLKSHDWYYDKSDDSRVYDRGKRQEQIYQKEMQKIADAGMAKEAMELYKKYAPEGYTITLREEEEEVEIEDEVEVSGGDEKEGIEVTQDAESDLTGVVGNVQDNLEAALESARELGDEKLVDQIGNTLTFFTRTHVVKENIELPSSILTKANQIVKDAPTMAQIMLDLYQLIQDKEQIDFSKNPKFNLALSKLKDLASSTGKSEDAEVKEAAEIDVDVDSPAEDAKVGMKLDESIYRMKKLAGLIK
tara:strand:- start:1389 stop:2129 length:741 start_codon:yes stop_codon:yes gene_type:complete